MLPMELMLPILIELMAADAAEVSLAPRRSLLVVIRNSRDSAEPDTGFEGSTHQRIIINIFYALITARIRTIIKLNYYFSYNKIIEYKDI